MVSIIIPAYKEPYLNKTIESILANAQSTVEVIPIIQDKETYQSLNPDPRVKPILRDPGLRSADNAGIAAAKGEYLLKIDAHCVVGPGFDKILSENCAENWLLIPRRYTIDEINWAKNEDGRYLDYTFIGFPRQSMYGCGLWAREWPEMRRTRHQYEIDDVMTLQESFWFVNRKYFMDHVGFLDHKSYGEFPATQQEIGLKYWLGGGQNKVIKKTWYCHLAKMPRHYQAGLFTREYKVSANTANSYTWAAKHWINNEEPGMIHKFSWLIDKFWPVREWPDDWQEKIKQLYL